jgi:hypothetical protein
MLFDIKYLFYEFFLLQLKVVDFVVQNHYIHIDMFFS